MTYKDILKVVPTLHAAQLVVGLTKKKKKKRGIIGDATSVLFGVPLIQAESQMIGGL